MEQERPHHLPLDRAVSATNAVVWPNKGAILFDNVCMRYRPGLPFVLRHVNLDISGGEKIGIVGRTGSGKSTLASCLLRLVELNTGRGLMQGAHNPEDGDFADTGSGTVYIDGVDISTVGLNKLRSNIAVIAQDPVLFSGTLRSNLDPFNQFPDAQLWDCMHRTRRLYSSLQPSTSASRA